ncbi:putative aig2 family protein [Phaeomoniella chlamydospora]|uniref:gamma-glutamylcyclotransferase n=1 Tax=Phaeomoniella chlamydospora TaxID=158046 RepID=A0A0G2EET2_PHACM|nr:putative aig2 family protein [Phaeomoniella chlamydospora]
MQETLYFAYGSNLSLTQMGKRCPESRLIGRGRLYGYVWQINERGFANVVKSVDSTKFVDGLCYLLNPIDVGRLDRSEGVPTAYQKRLLQVSLHGVQPTWAGRKVVDITSNRTPTPWRPVDTLTSVVFGPANTQKTNRSGPRASETDKVVTRCYSDSALQGNTGRSGGQPALALVYLSEKNRKPGYPWDEYIDRMRLGIEEAVQVGMAREPMERSATPYLQRGKGVRPVKGQLTKTTKTPITSKLSNKRKSISRDTELDPRSSRMQVDQGPGVSSIAQMQASHRPQGLVYRHETREYSQNRFA